jgi:ribonuclease D
MSNSEASSHSPNASFVSAPQLIVDERGVREFLAKASQASAVAVDTESNSLYAYYHRICLIQVSLPDSDYIIDPLAVDASPLSELFANPHCQKIFHAAENDILGLQRDYGFEFASIFDTMLAARILGWPRAGLAAILTERFGVQVDKRMQRTNWGQRPLQPAQLAYAQLDTHYLLPLQALQVAELRHRRRWAEAQDGFQRLTTLEGNEKTFDPDGFWRINGVRDLTPTQQAVLRELYLYREQQAQRLDRPPFKLLGEQVLLALAERQPAGLKALRQVHGMTAHQVRQWGDGILKAIARGQAAPPPTFPRRPNNGNGRPDAPTMARYEVLRRWRAERAAARGVDADIVLTNQALMALARLAPTSLEALGASNLLGPAKLQEYGDSILQALRKV